MAELSLSTPQAALPQAYSQPVVSAAPPSSDALRARLDKNLAALKVHRPALYALLQTEARTGGYVVGLAADGALTLAEKRDNGSLFGLSPSNQPKQGLSQVMGSLQANIEEGKVILLDGIGDGYALGALSAAPSPFSLGMETPLFILETDASLLLACLMIHDYSAPDGPISQKRVRWFVGSSAFTQLQDELLQDGMLPVPQVLVKLGTGPDKVSDVLQSIGQRLSETDGQLKQRIIDYLSDPSRPSLARLLSPNAPRKPRIALLTTRFSTVLQFCTADAAEGLRQAGWDVRVIIERESHQRLTRIAIRRSLATFRPDAVLQIDHHRHEHGDLFPHALPFICWIQDALPNLNSSEAGRKIGPTDFVMTALGALYRTTYQYPDRQIIDAHRFTRHVRRPLSWNVDGDHLVYVSHASADVRQIKDDLVGLMEGSLLKQLASIASDTIIDIFQQGRSCASLAEVFSVIESAERQHQPLHDATAKRQMAELIFYRLVNPLYRQQGVRWAAQVCKTLGLTLALYGKGWEKLPEFAPYARGVIVPGTETEELARRSLITLKLEPYFCISHQRALDALAAGGFCLFRRTPADVWIPQLAHLLHNIPELTRVNSQQELAQFLSQASTSAELRSKLTGLLEMSKTLVGFGDPVEMTRRVVRAGIISPAGQSLPDFDAVAFDDQASLQALVQTFHTNPTLRNDISQKQRQAVEERLSFASGLQRVMYQVARLIEEPDIQASVSARSILKQGQAA